MRKRYLFILVLLVLSVLIGIVMLCLKKQTLKVPEVETPSSLFTQPTRKTESSQQPSLNPAPETAPKIPQIPTQKTLENNYQVSQTFNNCGPATLSMALSYYEIFESQAVLGQSLRPYQVPNGDNDDKTVTMEELSQKAEEYGLLAYYRPAGNIDLVKTFITIDVPVLTKTWTKENEDIGHFRLIKGFDDTTSEIIQDDALQGKNLRYSYSSFNTLWEKFGYEYIVLVPPSQKELAEKILGENLDPQIAWKNAAKESQLQLTENPENAWARFNLSVEYYHLGEYQKSVEAFELVENQLPARTLWYQIEPIQSYFELKNYDRVFEITDQILNNQNRAFSELYIIRGKIYLAQGETDKAREEFELAVYYNKNLQSAQELLQSMQ